MFARGAPQRNSAAHGMTFRAARIRRALRYQYRNHVTAYQHGINNAHSARCA